MKNKYKICLIGLGIFISLGLFLVVLLNSTVNGVVRLEEQVNESISNVQVQQKRRMDLIPNFVNTVKDYKDFEQETLQQISEARSLAGEGKVEEAEKVITMVVENYPELKASELYQNLLYELANTENAIKQFREALNNQVKQYRRSVRSFPTSFIIGVMGYEVQDFSYLTFEEAEDVPVVNFE